MVYIRIYSQKDEQNIKTPLPIVRLKGESGLVSIVVCLCLVVLTVAISVALVLSQMTVCPDLENLKLPREEENFPLGLKEEILPLGLKEENLPLGLKEELKSLPLKEESRAEMNMRPIIGVLSQEVPTIWKDQVPNGSQYTSYISASYVKLIESGGARVAPIAIGQDQNFYGEIFTRINGLMLPGGLVSPYNSEYQRVAQIFYTLAVQANNLGDVFPIWGTCLGFQQLAVITAGYRKVVDSCNSYGQSLPLELDEDWKKSRMLANAPHNIIQYLTTLPITINFHHDCVSRDNFKKFNMSDFWLAISHNKDLDGQVFMGTIEAREFPFFATQWHPEKNPYEWDTTPNIKGSGHSREAIRMSFYMAEFFVDFARVNNHTFPDKTSEENALIYNNDVFYMANKPGNVFEQLYMLK